MPANNLVDDSNALAGRRRTSTPARRPWLASRPILVAHGVDTPLARGRSGSGSGNTPGHGGSPTWRTCPLREELVHRQLAIAALPPRTRCALSSPLSPSADPLGVRDLASLGAFLDRDDPLEPLEQRGDLGSVSICRHRRRPRASAAPGRAPLDFVHVWLMRSSAHSTPCRLRERRAAARRSRRTASRRRVRRTLVAGQSSSPRPWPPHAYSSPAAPLPLPLLEAVVEDRRRPCSRPR